MAMESENIKEVIDNELKMLCMSDQMKSNIKQRVYKKKTDRSHFFRTVIASLAFLIFGGTTVFAGYYIANKISVNKEMLPEIDDMQVVKMAHLNIPQDEYGTYESDFTDYDEIKSQIKVDLLDTKLSENNPYLQGHITTDNKDYCNLTMENYILGDTSNHQFLSEENRYTYEHGIEYYSPVSLTVDIIISEEQLKNGWSTDYLGMYEFVESYTSKQGYKVNLIQSTNGDDALPDGAIAEKCAIFVSDGIRYTLKGRTSIETLKEIIDSLE